MMRGGGVNTATNRRTRDEGSDKEGEDGKGEWWRRRTTADKEAGDDERWSCQRSNQLANKG